MGAGGLNALPLAAVGDLVPAAGARPLARLLRVRVRVLERARAGARRLLHRPPLVAVGLLHQRADRDRGDRDHRPPLPRHLGAAHAASRRLPRRGADRGRGLGLVLLCDWGGNREPWDSPVIVGLGVAAVALARRLPVVGTTGAGTDPALAALRRVDRTRVLRPELPHRDRVLLGHLLRPGVPAVRVWHRSHRLGAAHHPVHVRRGRGHDPHGAAHRPQRPLQASIQCSAGCSPLPGSCCWHRSTRRARRRS